jgi:hypothetical protein
LTVENNYYRLTNHPGIIKLKMFIKEMKVGVIEFADRGDLNGYLKHQLQPIGRLMALKMDM